jgi:hypothetical protein
MNTADIAISLRGSKSHSRVKRVLRFELRRKPFKRFSQESPNVDVHSPSAPARPRYIERYNMIRRRQGFASRLYEKRPTLLHWPTLAISISFGVEHGEAWTLLEPQRDSFGPKRMRTCLFITSDGMRGGKLDSPGMRGKKHCSLLDQSWRGLLKFVGQAGHSGCR